MKLEMVQVYINKQLLFFLKKRVFLIWWFLFLKKLGKGPSSYVFRSSTDGLLQSWIGDQIEVLQTVFFSSEFHEQRYLELYSPVSYQSSIYGFLEFHERTNHPYVDGIFSE